MGSKSSAKSMSRKSSLLGSRPSTAAYWDLVDGERKYAATAPAAARHQERAV
ncbi:hypothetical protein ABZ401_02585 [Streptomyces sp. NPDC005892]|uniref:hypothetical protein n=1 Tax=Streptomyces sp. NPDC005892 TaxID=3155593 RepID=UPI0033E490FD